MAWKSNQISDQWEESQNGNLLPYNPSNTFLAVFNEIHCNRACIYLYTKKHDQFRVVQPNVWDKQSANQPYIETCQ